MTLPSKISLSVFTLGIIILGAYGFIFFRERATAPEKVNPQQTVLPDSPTPSDSSEQASPTASDAAADNSAVDSPQESADENTPDESNNFLDISKSDCSSNCKDFTDSTDLKYCKDICGLTPTKKDIKEKKGCDVFTGLEKDYCLKDLAINTKDMEICTQISDTNVLKTCRNRVAEDIIEKQLAQ